MSALKIWQFWFCLFEQAMYVSTCTRCKTCKMCTKLVFVWQRAKFPRCAKWGSPGVCEMCAESLSNPFLLPWTCLVPLLTSWLLSHQQQRALQQFLILCPDGTLHMSCPVWCTCQCAIVLQGSATTWNPRESPRVWAPPSLQNWPQPSPPPPPHCPIVQASPTSNWVLHTFSS